MAKPKLKALMVRLPPLEYQMLRVRAAETGSSMAQYVYKMVSRDLLRLRKQPRRTNGAQENV